MEVTTSNFTTIRASPDAWSLIMNEKRIGESMSDVIERVFEAYNEMALIYNNNGGN